MKKCYFFLFLLCVAVGLHAQTQKQVHAKDLAQNPSLLTPQMGIALSKQGLDGDGYLPPLAMAGVFLTDSVYAYDWSALQQDWSHVRSYHYAYDCSNGHYLAFLIKLHDLATDEFVNEFSSTAEYYDNGIQKSSNSSTWDDDLNIWVHIGYSLSNEEGQLLETWTKSWDINDSEFYSGSRSLYHYDTESNLVLLETFDFDVPQSTWVLSQRMFYNYTNGLLIRDSSESFYGNTWNPSLKTEYTYNAQDQMLTKMAFQHNGVAWSPTALTTNTYNVTNQLIEELYQTYDGTAWVNYERAISTYYPNGNLQLRQSFIWVGVTQTWVESGDEAKLENGNEDYTILKFNYDEQLGGFLFGFWLQFGYNSEGLINSLLNKQLEFNSLDNWVNYDSITYEYDANNQLLEDLTNSWDEDSAEFQPSSRNKYFNTGCFYSNTDEPNVDIPPTCIYANPILSGQPIHCAALDANANYTLDLYSVTGARLHHQDFQSGDALTPSHELSPGIYLLHINSESGMVYCAKVVVAR